MNTDFEWLTGGGATSAQGFLACGVAAGIKLNRNDMAMVLSDRPATAAGLFTSNRVAAAPVVVDRDRVAAGRCRGVVVNAGCANACTGAPGHEDAVAMARMAAEAVGVPEAEMLVSSTGTIGRRLPMGRIAEAVAALNARSDAPVFFYAQRKRTPLLETGRFGGRERKRGALLDFCALLRGDDSAFALVTPGMPEGEAG